jgi:PKD repeat protein
MLVVLLVSTGCSRVPEPAEGAVPQVPDEQFDTLSHLRSAQLTWTLVSGRTVAFDSKVGLRRSAYGSPVVGTLISLPISFGDGSAASVLHTVVHVDAANDWILVEGSTTKTYSGTASSFVAFSQICCRLSQSSGHMNNGDRYNRAETLVSFQTAGSPQSSISPIVDCPKSSLCTFAVPATHPETGGLSFRFATPLEATGTSLFYQPGPPQATYAAQIDPSTGVYSWNTEGATLHASGDSFYSTQVMVEKSVNGSVVAKTPIDFFIRLTDAASSNNPPVFEGDTPADGTTIDAVVGSPVIFDVKASDPDDGDIVTLAILGAPAEATFSAIADNPATGTFSWTPMAAGSTILTLTAQDQLGLGALQRSVTIFVPANTAPTADAGGPYSGVEGAAVSFDGTASSDADGDTLSYAWDFGDGSTGTGATPHHTYADNGIYSVSLIVNDGTADSAPATASVTIENAAPSVVTIDVSAEVVAMNSYVEASATFTDAGMLDTHSASWDWGDGTSTTGSMTQGAGSGSAADGHTYTSPGVYTVSVTVIDNDGDSGSAQHQYVVVYDPDGGFVTGGGWFDSPIGAFAADPSLSGRANFGFVSRYQRGMSVPQGQTQFQFQAGSMNFHSTAYEWLVISGARAQYKGVGTINGSGNFGFILTAIDGSVSGGGGQDRLRLKVWDRDQGDAIVYDNQMAAADDDDPTTVIGGGSIKIHANGKASGQ